MSLKKIACEDLKAFERRLTEIITYSQPTALRWRVVLVVVSVCVAVGAWHWLRDPNTATALHAKEVKEPVAVHCRMGRGRTGTMLAAYLMNYEIKTAAEAIQGVRAARPGSVETKRQEESLQIWAKYLEDQQEKVQKAANFQDFLALAPVDTVL